jgi:hypothetical protein
MSTTTNLLILFLILFLSSCTEKGTKEQTEKKAKETSPPAQTPAQKSETKQEEKTDTVSLLLRGFRTYSNFSLADYLQRGVEVVFDNSNHPFNIIQLIDYAKSPRQVIVKADGFDNWNVRHIITLGARVVVSCKSFTPFEIQAFIDAAQPNQKMNVSVIGYYCKPQDLLEFVKSGAKVKVNKLQEPFHIVNLIDAGYKYHNKPLVDVDVEGFGSLHVKEFIRRGANIFVSGWYPGFNVYEFCRISNNVKKGKVWVFGNKYSLKENKRFLEQNATIFIGKDSRGTGFNAFEVAEIIQKNPSKVVVIGDFYQPHEIAKFIELGAKVVFLYRYQAIHHLNSYVYQTPPPEPPVLSQKNKYGYYPPKREYNYLHRPSPNVNLDLYKLFNILY